MTTPALIPAPVQPGDVLRGKYRVERLIGQGGMAYVVSAWHLHLDQRVAVKLLRPETAPHPEAVERFLREARAAARLESSHVARFIDVDTLESGPPFIVMEHLDGKDLAHVLQERAPLPPAEAAGWVRQACSAITEAHGLGIIHRDLKPANLFLAQKRSGEAQIKVLDFGISKLIQESTLTQTSVGMGSAEYMSPEQMRSAADVDPRSDIWSLGVTLYELTTGVTPFHADSVGQVAVAVLTGDPVPPRKRRPDLPAGLEAVILRCLDKDPSRRYASAADLAEALAPFSADRPSGIGRISVPNPPPSRDAPPSWREAPPSRREAPPSAPVAAPPSLAAPMSAPVPSAAPAPAGMSTAQIVAAAGVALLAVVVVVLAFVVGRHGGGGTTAPSAERFTLDATTLHDKEMKLTWQRTPAPGTVDWIGAKDYCARQRGGFRLPDSDELVSLFAFASAQPPLDPANFPTGPADVFWSASPAGPGAASVVHFSNGRRATSVISGFNRVRCVRQGS